MQKTKIEVVPSFYYLLLVLLLVLILFPSCNPSAEQSPPTTPPTQIQATTTVAATATPTEAHPTPKPQPTERVTLEPVQKESPTPARVSPTEVPTTDPPDLPTQKPSPKPTTPLPPTAVPTLSVSDIVDLLKKAMVRVKTDLGSGSGIIIWADGHILTCNHVLERAKDIKIIMPDEKEVSGKMLGRDEIRDVGLVKVEGKNLKIVPFGKSEDLRVGEEIMVIGFPLDLKGSATVSKGIVSAIRKDSDTGSTVIQTDAPVNPGNSGGALVNRKGEVVGVIVSKLVGTGVEGVAFATALSDITPVLPRLKAGEFIEAPYAKAEPVKKFESKKYLYSFSYPDSWKITDMQEDHLKITGPDASIYVKVEIIYGNLYDLGTTIKNWIEATQNAEPDFKVISNKVVSHGVSGIEVVYERLISRELTRVTWFFSQAMGGGRSRYMAYSIKGYISTTAIKKQQANINSFFNSLNIQP